MKSFVLMGLRNGELMQGHRVCFMDAYRDVIDSSLSEQRGWEVDFCMVQLHGWVIEHPKFDVPFFMNTKAEGLIFEVLGEL